MSINIFTNDKLADIRAQLPERVQADVLRDRSKMLEGRLGLLKRNGLLGLGLVIVLLSLFLKIKLAFWIMMGIPISFLGAIFLMPILDISINMISLFAFILVLGIVVDDAIVVGENIYAHMEMGSPPLQAAIEGTKEIASPVLLTILTNIVAFIPLLYATPPARFRENLQKNWAVSGIFLVSL